MASSKDIFHLLLGGLDLQKSMLYTLKSTFLEPENILKYINGERNDLANPFKYFLVVLGIAFIESYWTDRFFPNLREDLPWYTSEFEFIFLTLCFAAVLTLFDEFDFQNGLLMSLYLTANCYIIEIVLSLSLFLYPSKTLYIWIGFISLLYFVFPLKRLLRLRWIAAFGITLAFLVVSTIVITGLLIMIIGVMQ